jgi:hypothetical protein
VWIAAGYEVFKEEKNRGKCSKIGGSYNAIIGGK